MKKKVLILTASYGTGHITATKSVDNAIKQLYPDIETKVLDFLRIDEGLAQSGLSISKKLKKVQGLTLFQKLYNYSMEQPDLWDTFFMLTTNSLSIFVLKKIVLIHYYNKVRKILNAYKPDIIIAGHMFWNFIIEKYKKEVKNIPYICIVTDSYMIHQAWINKKVDYYCVIDRDTKTVLLQYGIKNIIITGFPVNPALELPVDKEKIFSELKLEKNRTTILVTIGLGALKKFLDIIEYLRKQDGKFQLILITGKYQELYEILKQKEYKIPTAVIGWTDRMADYIRVSDLIICKGGGAIVSESLTAKKPVLIPVFVPGQEKGNVYIVEKYGMGFYEIEEKNIYDLLNKIIVGEIDLSQYKSNIEKNIKTGATINIANLINNLIQQTK